MPVGLDDGGPSATTPRPWRTPPPPGLRPAARCRPPLPPPAGRAPSWPGRSPRTPSAGCSQPFNAASRGSAYLRGEIVREPGHGSGPGPDVRADRGGALGNGPGRDLDEIEAQAPVLLLVDPLERL